MLQDASPKIRCSICFHMACCDLEGLTCICDIIDDQDLQAANICCQRKPHFGRILFAGRYPPMLYFYAGQLIEKQEVTNNPCWDKAASSHGND